MKLMSGTPASSASAIALSMKGWETSIPTAEPSLPTSARSTWVVSPKPQPMSSTRSPLAGGYICIAALAVLLEPGDDQVAELDEAVEEDAAPCLGRLVVVLDDADLLFGPSCFHCAEWYAERGVRY